MLIASEQSNSIRYAQPLAPKRTPSQSLGTDFGMGLDIALQRVYDNSRVSLAQPCLHPYTDTLI